MVVAGEVAGSSGARALVVVWADPGEHLGWSVHRVPIARLVVAGQVGSVRETWWRTGVVRAGSTTASVDSYLALCRAAWERAGEDDVVVVGTEGFSLEMLSRDLSLLEPVRFNAVLMDRLHGTGVRVEVQQPGERKVITDARLQTWGLWKPGSGHARDAQRHGLLFLRRFATQPHLRARYGLG